VHGQFEYISGLDFVSRAVDLFERSQVTFLQEGFQVPRNVLKVFAVLEDLVNHRDRSM